jgi:fatty acid synthase
LAQLGLDSLTAVEIQESIEREFEVCLTRQEIQGLTLANVKQMGAKRLDTKVEEQLS